MESLILRGRYRALGQTGKLAENISRNWLIGLRETNPAILDMFYLRDSQPYLDLLPWSGEFAGKYIQGAYYIYRLTGDEKLREYMTGFIGELISTQAEDGYLGCYSEKCRLTGAFSTSPDSRKKRDRNANWDAWSHYHIMLGLLLWYDETNDGRMYDCVKKAAALFMRTFYGKKGKLADMGAIECNMSPIHVFTLLYERTGDESYLKFIRELEREMSEPDVGAYMERALAGVDYCACSNSRYEHPRWETLHYLMGIAELYRATGEEKYLDASKRLFYSALRTDIHNTGGFSTNEVALGTPYKNGSIEQCCVIAFNSYAALMYELTGDIGIIDYLELSECNAALGSFSVTGSWSTYNTPMDGAKLANYHHINFQSRPGSPQLNCCSANSANGPGGYARWALCRDDSAVYVNGWESFEYNDSDIMLSLTGDYPASPVVKLRAYSENGAVLMLRIPKWSASTAMKVNGAESAPEAGQYAPVTVKGEVIIELTFDFSVRIEPGKEDFAGKYSVYYGPVLYGIDVMHNNRLSEVKLNKRALTGARPVRLANGEIELKAGNAVLTDFYHLGQSGCTYRTWLTIEE